MAQKRNTGNKQNKHEMEFGKVPPQALDIEEAVLGALMIDKDAAIDVLDVLKPESFYKDSHQKIFQVILDLTVREDPVDLLTVSEELRNRGQIDDVGGPVYLTELTSRVASSAHVEFHSRIIAQKYIQRELIRITSVIQEKAFDNAEDVNDLLDFSEGELFNLAQGNVKKESASVKTVIQQALHEIEEASKKEGSVNGIPSGFTGLDRVTNGWQKSDLVIIAARPSMGKTAFVLSMARNMAVEHNAAVAIFSLEMSSVQLVNRLIVGETYLSADKLRTGNLEDYEWQQLDHKIKRLVEAPIYIDDTPAISIFELRAKCRRLKRKHDINLVVIDYLQLMSGPPETRGNREQEVSLISRALKVIAKELDVPILALSQLNRSVEMRAGDKRPQLSDLRESGAIEQDADMVLFIHRPEKYGFTQDEEGNSLIGMADIIIAKHRNGGLDDVRLKFEGQYVKFVDPEGGSIAPFSDSSQGTATLQSKMNEDKEESAVGQNNSDLDPFNSSFEDDAPF